MEEKKPPVLIERIKEKARKSSGPIEPGLKTAEKTEELSKTTDSKSAAPIEEKPVNRALPETEKKQESSTNELAVPKSAENLKPKKPSQKALESTATKNSTGKEQSSKAVIQDVLVKPKQAVISHQSPEGNLGQEPTETHPTKSETVTDDSVKKLKPKKDSQKTLEKSNVKEESKVTIKDVSKKPNQAVMSHQSPETELVQSSTVEKVEKPTEPQPTLNQDAPKNLESVKPIEEPVKTVSKQAVKPESTLIEKTADKPTELAESKNVSSAKPLKPLESRVSKDKIIEPNLVEENKKIPPTKTPAEVHDVPGKVNVSQANQQSANEPSKIGTTAVKSVPDSKKQLKPIQVHRITRQIKFRITHNGTYIK